MITAGFPVSGGNAFADPAAAVRPRAGAYQSPGPASCPGPSPGGTPGPSATQAVAVPAISLNPVGSVLSLDNQHPVVAGTVSELLPGAAAPVPYANQQIVLADSVLGDLPLVTDACGGFSFAPYAHPVAGETFTVQVPATASTAAAQTSPVTFTVRTGPVKPVAVSAFRLSLTQYWQVAFRGCLSLAPGTPGTVRSLAGLVIQYSAGRNGPWHRLGAVPPGRGARCGSGGLTFGGVLNARLNYAYYRAVYPGGTDRAGTGYLPATSGKVLAWKYADRIAGLRVAARGVPKGGKLTVSGRLQFYASGWRNPGRQRVQVILRPAGSGNWYWIARPRTNSGGYFSVTFTDPVSASWAAEYLGDKARLATVSALAYVRVAG